MNLKSIKKILVIKLRHIGDVLFTVPVLRALRETFPDAHISALVNSGTEEALKGNPLTVIVTSSPEKREMEKAKRILSLIPSRNTHYTSRLIDLCGKTTINNWERSHHFVKK